MRLLLLRNGRLPISTSPSGRYVIMPDHLHLFVAGPNEFDLGNWIGVLKRTLAKALPETGSKDPIWQRGFFDHVLRSDESYAQKWEMCAPTLSAPAWLLIPTRGLTPARSS